MTLNLSIIQFPKTDYAPTAVNITQPLSLTLTLQNSPILFGCRTGICGTCLVVATGNMLPPNEEETEVLSILAPGIPTARLACQLIPTGDLSMTPLKL